MPVQVQCQPHFVDSLPCGMSFVLRLGPASSWPETYCLATSKYHTTRMHARENSLISSRRRGAEWQRPFKPLWHGVERHIEHHTSKQSNPRAAQTRPPTTSNEVVRRRKARTSSQCNLRGTDRKGLERVLATLKTRASPRPTIRFHASAGSHEQSTISHPAVSPIWR